MLFRKMKIKDGRVVDVKGFSPGQKVIVNIDRRLGGQTEKGRILESTPGRYTIKLESGEKIEIEERFVKLDWYAAKDSDSLLFTEFFEQGRYMKEGQNKTFDEKELAMGKEVEYEHTDNPIIAERIALDHLTEIPDYYTRLKKMEEEAKR